MAARDRRCCPGATGELETPFAVANGYLGMRAAHEEGVPVSHPELLARQLPLDTSSRICQRTGVDVKGVRALSSAPVRTCLAMSEQIRQAAGAPGRSGP